jgi:hypothetical protein
MAKMTMPAFERSKFDKDKGMKEGSPADVKKDKAALAKINAKGAKGAKPAKKK